MLRYGMSRSDECERCGEVETYKHLFWECLEPRRVWRAFNKYLGSIGHQNRVNGYEDVFTKDKNQIIMVKLPGRSFIGSPPCS